MRALAAMMALTVAIGAQAAGSGGPGGAFDERLKQAQRHAPAAPHSPAKRTAVSTHTSAPRVMVTPRRTASAPARHTGPASAGRTASTSTKRTTSAPKRVASGSTPRASPVSARTRRHVASRPAPARVAARPRKSSGRTHVAARPVRRPATSLRTAGRPPTFVRTRAITRTVTRRAIRDRTLGSQETLRAYQGESYGRSMSGSGAVVTYSIDPRGERSDKSELTGDLVMFARPRDIRVRYRWEGGEQRTRHMAVAKGFLPQIVRIWADGEHGRHAEAEVPIKANCVTTVRFTFPEAGR